MADAEPPPRSDPDATSPVDAAAVDLQRLFARAESLALDALASGPGFTPFALTLCGPATGDDPIECANDPARTTATPERTLVDRLYAHLFVEAGGTLRAYAVVRASEMVHHATGVTSEVIMVDLEHVGAPPVTIYREVVRSEDDPTTVTCGRAIPTDGEPVVFGGALAMDVDEPEAAPPRSDGFGADARRHWTPKDDDASPDPGASR